MNYYAILPLITSILLFMLGIFVLSKNMKSRLNSVFFLLCLTSTIWLFSNFISFSEIKIGNISFWLNLAYCGVVFIAITIFHYTVVFLKLDRLLRYAYFNYVIGFVIVFLIWRTNYILSGAKRFFWGYYPFAGLLNPAFIIYFIFLVVFSCIALLYCGFFRKPKILLIKKMQIKYMLLAIFIYSLASVDFVANYKIELYPFGYIPTFIFVLIIGYTMVRYRLMDVTLVITRAGIFMVIYSFILGLPLLLIYYFQNELVRILGLSWWIVPFLFSTALATSGPFLYIYFDKKAGDRLLREQRNYQNILRNASKGMIRIKNLKHLLNLIVHVVMKAVKLKNVSIYLLDHENSQFILQAERGLNVDLDKAKKVDLGSSLTLYFESKNEPVVTEEAVMRLREAEQNVDLNNLVSQLNLLNAALAVPCFLEEKLIGILILGEKRSKKLYSEDDLAVFSVLANQAALAIENAQFYDEIQRTNEQLIQAEKLATIGTMADGLSHQINNRFHALSLISGDSLDVLQTFDFSGCDEKVKEVVKDVRIALEKIQNNVLQGGEVVKGLLKYSRPEEGGFEPVCLIEVINGAIEMVQYKIKLKEIRLIQNIPIGLPKLLGSRIQLQEVFFNLIDNAYDAIKERQMILKEYGYKGKIEISAVCLDGHVEIVIVDNGIGVKEQDRKKLFAPFFTTKASSRKGTGLGLYVIEKIVTAHQGKLSVDSNYGVGTHFVMMLPTVKS